MPTVRGQPRLVYQPHLYQRLLDLQAQPAQRAGVLPGHASPR